MSSDASRAAAAAKAAFDRHRKVPLRMPEGDRRDLMDVLLNIHRIAMVAFDALEANQVSAHELEVIVQLPDACNRFTGAMEAHARRLVGEAGG